MTYLSATDDEALEAFQLCCRLEGIIPALEPAHALAKVLELAPKKPKDHLMVMNMCGRGDKDIFTVAEHLGGKHVISRQKIVGWMLIVVSAAYHRLFLEGEAAGRRSGLGEGGLGALHRLDRDCSMHRHRQCAPRRDAGAETANSMS